MAQVQSLHAKMLADSRMRDIRRRVEVIQKKLADLQEMGVPCAFCYSSVRNTGSIFTLGDKRITDVIERYRNEILCNMMEENMHTTSNSDPSSSLQEIHLILPVLPAPLEELNRSALQSMIIGILKDLGIRWSDPKPVWWPEGIPFVPPRSVPENFTGPGNWLTALRSILKSVYGYFSYDIDSYIASKLEPQSINSVKVHHPLKDQRGSNRHCFEGVDEEEEEEEVGEDDADNEGDSDHTDEASGSEEARESFSKSMVSRFYIGKPRVAVTSNLSPAVSDTTVRTSIYSSNATLPQKPTTSRPISSFTVENILSSTPSCPTAPPPAPSPVIITTLSSSLSTSSSYSSVSHSPTSSHSSLATTTSLPSPTSSNSISSSIVGVNWVSHPPVKYTKFTILSPTAMSDEAAGKKKKAGESSNHSAIAGKSIESREAYPASSAGVDLPQGIKMPQQVLQPQQQQCSSVDHKPTTTSASPLQVYSLSSIASSSSRELQASIPLSTSARLCSLPVVTTLQQGTTTSNADRKVVLSKTFPPSQQYVLLVPSTSSSGGASTSHVVQSVPYNSTLVAQKSPISSSVSAGNALTRPSMTAISFQSPPTATPSPSSKLDTRLDRGLLGSSSSSSNSVTSSNHPPSESNSFRLIAPKMRRSSSTGSPSLAGGRGRASHQRSTTKPPQKLRFHMTTVVTRQKRMPVKSSMTVESPSSVMNEQVDVKSFSVRRRGHDSDSDLPIESMITRSPNMYSMASAASLKDHMEERAQDMQEYSSTRREGENRPGAVQSQNGMRLQTVASSTNGTKNNSPPRARAGLDNSQAQANTNHQSSTSTAEKVSASPMVQDSKEIPITRQRRRATRSYTRRKRELTFHLYEDPGTAFKAKRACKE